MTPRGLLTTIGAAALGFGIVIGGATAPPAFAQEETPAVEAPAPREQAGDMEAVRAEAYEAFVAALASELGADDAEVDAAIRTALKEQIAQQEEAGNLDAEMASELEEMIDSAEAPLFGMLGMGGRGGMHVFKGGHFEGRGEHHGPRGGFDDRDDRDESASERESVPATLPSGDDAADQGASS